MNWKKDWSYLGCMSDADYFDGSTCARAKKPTVSGVMLFTGTYPKGHPYLKFTIKQKLDKAFVQKNISLFPACWVHS